MIKEICKTLSEVMEVLLLPLTLFIFFLSHKDTDRSMEPDVVWWQGDGVEEVQATVIDNEVLEDSVSALRSLGISAKAAKEKVQHIMKANPEADIETIIKTALKR